MLELSKGDEVAEASTAFPRLRTLLSFRFIVDEGEIIILRSMIDFGDRQLPASVRKPGA